MTTAASGSIWRLPDFRKLWLGQSVSLLGDQLTLLAVPVLAALTLHASVAEIAAIPAAARLPILLIGLPVGAWVDRWDKRSVLIAADAARFGVASAIPVAAATHVLTAPALLVAVLAAGIATVFFQVAYISYLPSLVDDEHRLSTGNMLLVLSESMSLALGPGLAGILITHFGVTGRRWRRDAARQPRRPVALRSARARPRPAPVRRGGGVRAAALPPRLADRPTALVGDGEPPVRPRAGQLQRELHHRAAAADTTGPARPDERGVPVPDLGCHANRLDDGPRSGNRVRVTCRDRGWRRRSAAVHPTSAGTRAAPHRSATRYESAGTVVRAVWRGSGAAALTLALVSTLVVNVPINVATSRWNPDSRPPD